MEFRSTEIAEVIEVIPTVYGDHRGFFLETWHAERYAENGIALPFVQDNHSKSSPGILRGLHAQLARPQGKLVRCLEGAIFDVAADVRRGSPTFGQWVGRTLSAENHHQLWVPPGFVHGFCVLGDAPAQVAYKCTDLYDQADEYGVRWDDPDLGIEWPIDDPTLSAKDAAAPLLAEHGERLPAY
ncbi:MAG: dTDP-4-dehydrorhamnose 3,5-epimerase [Acidobacteriota bacterium]